MGDQTSIGFAAGDCFLRRVSKPRAVRNNVVTWEAFSDSWDTLSFTSRDANLLTDHGLRQYQLDKALPRRDLPGICQLSFEDLAERLEPPLPPRNDPAPDDDKYGHLHCVTDRPYDEAHRIRMATLATEHGVLLNFVPRRKRQF